MILKELLLSEALFFGVITVEDAFPTQTRLCRTLPIAPAGRTLRKVFMLADALLFRFSVIVDASSLPTHTSRTALGRSTALTFGKQRRKGKARLHGFQAPFDDALIRPACICRTFPIRTAPCALRKPLRLLQTFLL